MWPQLLTARKKECSGRSQRTVYPRRSSVNCETHCVSGNRTPNLPL